MNWIAFKRAITTPYMNTHIDFDNNTGSPVNVEVRYGPYAIENLSIPAGTISYPLSALVNWKYLGAPSKKTKNLEQTVFITDVDGLEVAAHIEHNQMWIDRKPENDIYIELPWYKCTGDPPFGTAYGRQGEMPGPERAS